MAIKSHTTVG